MIRDAIDREVEAVDSGESQHSKKSKVFWFAASLRSPQRFPTPAISPHLPVVSGFVFPSFCLLRVPAGQAVGLPQEGDAVWQFGQTGTPYGQVLLGWVGKHNRWDAQYTHHTALLGVCSARTNRSAETAAKSPFFPADIPAFFKPFSALRCSCCWIDCSLVTHQEMPRRWSRSQRSWRSMSISGCVPSGRSTTLPTIWPWPCSQKVSKLYPINYPSRISLLIIWQELNWIFITPRSKLNE